MANLEEDAPNDGSRREPSARRQPPTIDAEAVELPIDGAAAPQRPQSDPPDTANDTAKATRPVVMPVLRTRWAAIGSLAVAVIAAAALWLYFAPGGDRGADEWRARIASLEARQHDDTARLALRLASVDAERAKVDDLTARLARLEAAVAAGRAAAPADAALANRLAALEAAAKPMAARLDEIERQTRDNAAAARTAGERADTVAGELGELKKTGADATAQPGERAAFAGLAARLEAVEGLAATLKSAQERADKSAAAAAATMAAEKPLRVAMIAAALRAAVERADPFAAELAAARTFGLDANALAALQPFAVGGVPGANEMFRELSALLPELARVSLPAGHDGNYLEHLQAGAERLVRIRPVGDVPGDDAATVIGRIEFKMTRQDVAGVVADLDKLPAAARELAQPWRKKALARDAAIDAARQLATAAFARLGEAPDLSPR